MRNDCTDQELIEAADGLHATMCSVSIDLLGVIAEVDRRELWRDSGARDTAMWVSMRYGISYWKARRWIACAHALEDLPRISEAFSSGELGMDKVVELTRLATSENESTVLAWARRVSARAVRDRADLQARRALKEVREIEQARSTTWDYYDEGKRFALHAELPAAHGPVVTTALDRLAQDLPVMPGEEDPFYMDARRADALVVMCSATLGSQAQADPDRATVIIHARGRGDR